MLASGLLSACSSPLDSPETDDARLRAAIARAIQQETGDLEGFEANEAVEAQRYSSDLDASLAGRADALRLIGPQPISRDDEVDEGVDLLGAESGEHAIGLSDALLSAIEHNLVAESARLTERISDVDITYAQAAFDAVLFSDFSFQRIDQKQVIPTLSGQPLTTSVNDTKAWNLAAGLQQQMDSGGTVEIATTVGYNDLADSDNIAFRPDPAWATAVRLGITQPLLRGFGKDVARSEIRLAESTARGEAEAMRAALLDTVAMVEARYWNLVLARQRLTAAQWLLDEGIAVRDVLGKRRKIDVTEANFADAVATVERRRGDVIELQRALRMVNDELKAAVNDPRFPLGGETMFVPADELPQEPIVLSLHEALRLAIEQSPSVRQALVGIEAASIGIDVARNGLLPTLDLEAQVSWNGLEEGLGSSYSDLGDGKYLDTIVGLAFAQAIGNRAAESNWKTARLWRTSAVNTYQQAVQTTVLQVKTALRDVRTNLRLIGQTSALRMAQAENLRALLVEERTKVGMTPEFLALKFQRQDGLAKAQVRATRARVDYAIAIARLQRAMGTGLRAHHIALDAIE